MPLVELLRGPWTPPFDDSFTGVRIALVSNVLEDPAAEFRVNGVYRIEDDGPRDGATLHRHLVAVLVDEDGPRATAVRLLADVPARSPEQRDGDLRTGWFAVDLFPLVRLVPSPGTFQLAMSLRTHVSNVVEFFVVGPDGDEPAHELPRQRRPGR